MAAALLIGTKALWMGWPLPWHTRIRRMKAATILVMVLQSDQMM